MQFGQVAWKPDIEHMVTEFTYQHIKEIGFVRGAFLSKELAEGPILTNWTGLIGLTANHVAALRAKLGRAAL